MSTLESVLILMALKKKILSKLPSRVLINGLKYIVSQLNIAYLTWISA